MPNDHGIAVGSRILYGFASLGLSFILSFIVMAASVGEDCGFYPGMLVVGVFGPLLLKTVYGAGVAILMVVIGITWKKRGIYVNGGIVVLALALFAFLALASYNGFAPWHSRCTIDF